MARRQKIFEGLKKVLALSLAAAMIVCMVPMDAKAAEPHTWTALGNGRYQLDGTAVIFEVQGQTLNVTGTGEVPDFDYWELVKTPWAGSRIASINIAGSVTSIGKYVFANPDASDFANRPFNRWHETEQADGIMNQLKYVTMSTTTFIKDWTTFNKSGQRVIFRIQSNGVTTKMIGTIPYTSLDSIKAMAQASQTGTSFIFDSHEKASEFQNSTNPTIQNVYAAKDIVDNTAPWNDLDKYQNGNIYTKICEMTPNPGYIVTAAQKYQGEACYQAFAAYIGNDKLGSTFNITVTDKSTERNRIMKSDTPYQFTLTIPKDLVKAGRTFRLIGLAEDVVNVFDDMDSNNGTITFSSNRPTATYALIYTE